MRRRQVVVIGSNDAADYLDEAFEIGRYIAKNNWVLITGGRSGIMEAASRGADGENGIVVGILPDNGFSDANAYCSIVIPTGIGFARNMINVLSADVIVAIGGGYGTLSELAYARQFTRPVISCIFSNGWSRKFAELDGKDDQDYPLYRARNIHEVFRHLDALLK